MRVPSPHGGHEPEVEGMSAQTDLATGALAYLLAGPAGFGVVGLLLDRWWGTWFALPVGVVAGMAASMYVIWLRYGRS